MDTECHDEVTENYTNAPEFSYWLVDGMRPGGVFLRIDRAHPDIQHTWYCYPPDSRGYWDRSSTYLRVYINQGFPVRQVTTRELPVDARPYRDNSADD
jgi:hypothetical protein